MSWIALIDNNKFTIITGDGKEYLPKWSDAKKRINFHNSKFDYPGVEGTYVNRKEKTGDSYNLNIYFDGGDCIEKGKAFEESTKDERAWTLLHPFYGIISIQPTDIDIDTSNLNVWKATINATATLASGRSKLEYNTIDEIKEAKAKIEDVSEDIVLSEKTVTEVSENISTYDKAYGKVLKAQKDFEQFKKIVGKATGEIANKLADAKSTIRLFSNIISYPIIVEQSLSERFDSLKNTFDELINKLSPENYQYQATNLVANLSYMSIIAPPVGEDSTYNFKDEYKTRNDIVRQVEKIRSVYENYLLNIEKLEADGFIPDFRSLELLDFIIVSTVRNLESQIFGLKKEISYTLYEDSNAILLTQKFYGLDKEDKNLERFMSINEIGINQLFSIPKGTKIKYYA